MLSKEFIKFAMPFLYDDTEWPCELNEAIEAEIAAAVKAEREACAAVVESKWQETRDTEFDLGFETARKCFAAAIRSRNR